MSFAKSLSFSLILAGTLTGAALAESTEQRAPDLRPALQKQIDGQMRVTLSRQAEHAWNGAADRQGQVACACPVAPARRAVWVPAL